MLRMKGEEDQQRVLRTVVMKVVVDMVLVVSS